MTFCRATGRRAAECASRDGAVAGAARLDRFARAPRETTTRVRLPVVPAHPQLAGAVPTPFHAPASLHVDDRSRVRNLLADIRRAEPLGLRVGREAHRAQHERGDCQCHCKLHEMPLHSSKGGGPYRRCRGGDNQPGSVCDGARLECRASLGVRCSKVVSIRSTLRGSARRLRRGATSS